MSDSQSLVRPVGLGVVLTVLLGVAGCGAVDQAGGGDVAAFCDAYVEMRQASDTDQDLASLSEQPETLFDDVEANAPPEVSEPVGVVVDATRQAAVDETPEAFMSRAFSDAENEVASYMFDNCEAFAKLDVTAVEYAFEGVPDSVTAGGIALRFTNEGDQFHEFILFRKNDGVTESFDEILALPEGQREELMTFAGAANREPGEPPIVTVFQAEAGEYIALCFVPVEGDGQPHFVEGQRAEFTVE
jgi:hypothetical protein